ncbi:MULTISPECIES: S1C family serine protease [unclassified Nocardioides]|uniref:S1C family serine protease n=1 Tax=unclassified Nocardioides TaxID=2615069 RepID=UPI0036140686
MTDQPTVRSTAGADRADRADGRGRLLSGLVGGVVGGLVGGGLVALAGWAADWGSDPASAAVCAVDDVAVRALPSVVTIAAKTPEGGGTGSGVVYDLDGETVIITNEHVVAPGATQPTAVAITYTDGHSTPATILGADALTDLAVLAPEESSEAAEPIRVGDSGALDVGNPVVALGSPLGLTSTVTSGIVSATGRYVRVPGAGGGSAHLVGAIQTDAAINPGNSGGALVDCDARLVGINTAGASPAGEVGSSGLGFAIPTVLALPLVDELAENGRVAHPTLGLRVQAIPPDLAAPGRLFVQGVDADGPADRAGVQPGDVLVEIDGRQLQSPEDLVRTELELAAGDDVEVVLSRGGEEITLTLTAESS